MTFSTTPDLWRREFTQIERKVHGRGLVYLDSAATTLKPASVVKVVSDYLSQEVANIHRGAHFLGAEGTTRYEAVREKVRKFINAAHADEIIFTKGTTEGLNLIATIVGRAKLKAGDEILISEMEHHSNIVPWQLIADQMGAKVKAVRVTETGEIDQQDFRRQLSNRVKLVSLVQVSNALGTVNPLEEILAEARAAGAMTVVDAAQSVALGLVDVKKLACDFLVFSGHKIFAPTGVGVVFGKREILAGLPPYQGGGSMIDSVEIQSSTFLPPPHRYEAGTPPIAEVLGLGAALDFLAQLDLAAVRRHEAGLTQMALAALEATPGVRLVGRPIARANVISFLLEGTHPGDLGDLLDQQGIAIRTGHHCCQPLMQRLGIFGTVRVSFSLYSSASDVENFMLGLVKAKELLQ